MDRPDRAGLVAAVEAHRRSGRTIGLVPTMGYLHDGHLSLIRRARAENDRVVLSIFVNPLQFGPAEDLARYPRDLERDLRLAAQGGVDHVFAPEVEDLYPGGDIATRVAVGRIGEIAEGRYRPGHFDGVATVCLKLFNLARPHRAYFGRKDAQQLAVVRRMVADLDIPVEIVSCPTIREPDGLAMSSRNVYLDEQARAAAGVLPKSLVAARHAVASGQRSAGGVRRLVEEVVAAEPSVRLQYVEVVDPESFEPLEVIEERATVAVAALVGTTRLIDNIDIDVGTGRPA